MSKKNSKVDVNSGPGMKKKKIIHFFPMGEKKANFPGQESPYYYLAGWASLQARSTLKYSDKYELEVWRSDGDIDKFEAKNIEGIECKLFPVKKNKKFSRLTLSLIKNLRNELRNNLVLINLHKIHTIDTTLLVWLFGNYPIVLHHHGSIPYEARENTGIMRRFLWRIFAFIDKCMLKRIDYFSVISASERDYLAGFIDPGKIKLEQGRKYFSDWLPIDKTEAKKKIGIDRHKKVIIYIGYYYKLKGVDILLDAYLELKKKYDVDLLMLGGLPENHLYGRVKSSGARDFGIVPNNEVPLYLSSADVYCAPAIEGTWVDFGGISTAVIEALACNVPVVSRQLIHFPTVEWKKVGEIPGTPADVKKCIEKIFNNPGCYSPRKTARKYYDFEVIIKDNISVYDRLFSHYYGV